MDISETSIGVLFVCLGNICRSPLAEGVFREQVRMAGLTKVIRIDSCGTGDWHVGHPPHDGSLRIAAQHGICIKDLRARQLSADDFLRFQIVVAMDSKNLQVIKSFPGHSKVNIFLLREFEPRMQPIEVDTDVPDPYYTGGFLEVYQILDRCCSNLLVEVRSRLR